MGEEKSPETTKRKTHIHNLSNKEFRDEMVRVVNDIKETVEQTSNKIHEDMKQTVGQTANRTQKENRAEIRKLQSITNDKFGR